MTGRSIFAVVFGILGLLLGIALTAGGVAVLIEDRDADGFYMSQWYTFDVSTRAIVAEDVALINEGPSWLSDGVTDPVDLRIRAESTTGKPVFIGVAATDDVAAYLAGVPHALAAV